ncbi:Ras GTPase-activating protein 3 [Galemys pyrenaicus]|uniref:Ras GTPase-activating protein 3 n=1 Tax=Galemys pyrenaicus TaxID=202257 RepID=A0A8J5ZDI2_GALPY|nr:Ras GTPase-activating protein 3 [Galemys pyrenaicus]
MAVEEEGLRVFQSVKIKIGPPGTGLEREAVLWSRGPAWARCRVPLLSCPASSAGPGSRCGVLEEPPHGRAPSLSPSSPVAAGCSCPKQQKGLAGAGRVGPAAPSAAPEEHGQRDLGWAQTGPGAGAPAHEFATLGGAGLGSQGPDSVWKGRGVGRQGSGTSGSEGRAAHSRRPRQGPRPRCPRCPCGRRRPWVSWQRENDRHRRREGAGWPARSPTVSPRSAGEAKNLPTCPGPSKMRGCYCTVNLDQEEVFRTQTVEKSLW